MPTADEQAILNEGLALSAFPPLERDLDYVANDYLPLAGYVLESDSAIFDIASASLVDPVAGLTESVTFTISHAATVDPVDNASLSHTFTISHAAIIDAVDNLVHAGTFDLTHTASADVSIDITQFDTFTISTTFVADPLDELSAASVVTFSSIATIDPEAGLSYDNTFDIVSEADIHVPMPADMQSDTVFGIISTMEVVNETYYRGDILNLPLWPFAPNWTSPVTENLAWLTDIMASPTGSEQRRSQRYYPRRTFEFEIATAGRERSFLDNFLISYGAKRFYLPLFSDVNLLDADVAKGATSLPCSTASLSKIHAGSVICLMGDDAFNSEMLEVSSVTDDAISLLTPTLFAWSADTAIYPAGVSRLTDQSELSKRNDALVTATMKFQIVQPNIYDPGDDSGLDDVYRSFPVLNDQPDEKEDLTLSMQRMLVEMDNATSIPVWQDTAARAFTVQQYAWVLEGRSELSRFEALLQSLRGQAKPLWVPTFMEDLQLVDDLDSGATAITTFNSGFIQCGGPRGDRMDIMIETLNARYYRRITNTAYDADRNEILGLDAPLPAAIKADNVVRISFMTLMRLNQDAIDIVHQTDDAGFATAQATFRSAPDTRVPTAGF